MKHIIQMIFLMQLDNTTCEFVGLGIINDFIVGS
jgi:hypothetical protein